MKSRSIILLVILIMVVVAGTALYLMWRPVKEPEHPAQEPAPPVQAGFDTVPCGDFVVLTSYTYEVNARPCDIAVTDESIWIAHERGISEYAFASDSWRHIGRSEGLPGDMAIEIEIHDRRIIADVRTRHDGKYIGGGIYAYHTESNTWDALIHGRHFTFFDIQEPRWMHSPGKYAMGIEIHNLHLNTTRTFTASNSDLVHDNVHDALVEGDHVWVASIGVYDEKPRTFHFGGVSWISMDTGEGTNFTARNGLAHSYCSALAATPERLWVAHWREERGLSCFNKDTRTWEQVRESANGIRHIGGVILESHENKLFIGQQGSLIVMDAETREARRYTEKDGLPGYIVASMQKHGRSMWIACYSYDEEGRVIRSGLVQFPL